MISLAHHDLLLIDGGGFWTDFANGACVAVGAVDGGVFIASVIMGGPAIAGGAAVALGVANLACAAYAANSILLN